MSEPVDNITLREHMDGKIDSMERHIDSRFRDMERHLTSKIEAVGAASAAANEVAKQAVAKAEVAVERRLEGLNELRGVVTDYQRTLLPRSEADARFSTIEDKIDKLEKYDTAHMGRSSGLAAGWAYLIATVGLVGAVAGILFAIFG